MTETYTAFAGERRIASGALPDMLAATKAWMEREGGNPLILFFEDRTGRQVDFDLRGTVAAVLERVQPQPARTGPGRPKLGVVAREVTLLPRHWEWLEAQPQGASAALRRLVDQARKQEGGEIRLVRDAVYRFLSAMGGNLPGFEEASRALYAGDRAAFQKRLEDWPEDIRDHALRLAAGVP